MLSPAQFYRVLYFFNLFFYFLSISEFIYDEDR